MNATCFSFPSTLPGRATWAANPTCRGTFEIITLCLSTTIICIWSSIHNDIPAAQPPPKGRDGHSDARTGCIRVVVNATMYWLRQKFSGILRILRNKGPTVVVAIFCPALLLLRAIDQYSSARKLRDLAKEKFDIQFTIVHGFYATMGGFQLDVRDHDSPTGEAFKDVTVARKRLSAAGVRTVIDRDPRLLPVPSLESIKERAKSNSLGKAVLALQVVWFIVNCASRLAENLPLSLMEVSTLAHGLCTLLTYFAWWSKPLNVEGPTRIVTKIENERWVIEEFDVGTGDDAKRARWKQFFDGHRYSDYSEYVEELLKTLPVDASLRDDPVAQARELAKDLKFLVDGLQDRQSRDFREGPKYKGEAGEASKDKILDGVRDIFNRRSEIQSWRLREAAYNASERSLTTPMAMASLDMDYRQSYPRKDPQDINLFDLFRPKSSRYPGTNTARDEGRNFSEYFLHETSPTFHDLFSAFALMTKEEVRAIDYVSLSVTPLLYGSLHLLGWWKQFPSSAEQIVWRVATVIAMSSGFAATVVSRISAVTWCDWRGMSLGGVLLQLLHAVLVCWIIPFLYVLSSTFLIVESIRQLWFLPSEAYIVASWSYYFPHLF